MRAFKLLGTRTRRRSGMRGERGAIIVVAMVFIMVFLVLGIALYWLVTSQIRSTDMERTDVKSFNVAEAGIDQALLELKLHWPDTEPPSDAPDLVNSDDLKTKIREDNKSLWLPTSPDRESEFIQVAVYDNVNAADPNLPDTNAPTWDSNRDGKMFVDSTANVGNDRHRILVLAERQTWVVDLPTAAMYAGRDTYGNSANGLRLGIDYAPAGAEVYASVHGNIYDVGNNPAITLYPLGAGETIDPRWVPDYPLSERKFEEFVTDALMLSLRAVADKEGHLYHTTAATEAFLKSGNPGPGGSIVYLEWDPSDTKTINVSSPGGGGDHPIGAVNNPVLLVIDAPLSGDTTLTLKGNNEFYGLVLVRGGSILLDGSATYHGGVIAERDIKSNGGGGGNPIEINYDQRVFDAVKNAKHIISVSIVPNSWQEYALPATQATPTTLAGN